MYLDLQDPDSIVSWWREFPERHWAYLDALDQLTPQFRASIQLARQRIRQQPDFPARLDDGLVHRGGCPLAPVAKPEDDEDDTQDFAPKYGALH